MRPTNLKTKIFLDSGDPQETKKAASFLGFLDGQTTNPTLIAKNPQVKKRLADGRKFSENEVFDFYKNVVEQIAQVIPEGSVSVEVYADKNTSSEDMLRQARKMFAWIPNAHIKLPITEEGLLAAEQAVKEGIRINMTLCFSQEQVAAVYASTKGAKRGQVFVSPFVGRLDDRGENGMDLIANILKMYQKGDGHVEILTASVRNIEHLLYALKLGSDIITAPFQVLKEWVDSGFKIPDESYQYNPDNLKSIPYKELNLNMDWQEYNITHKLTDIGLKRFADDWNTLVAKKEEKGQKSNSG